MFTYLVVLLLHCGCGGRGSRRSFSQSNTSPLLSSGDNYDGFGNPTVQTVVAPPTIREYFFPREAGFVKPKDCSKMNRAGWTQKWIDTCGILQEFKNILRKRDREEAHPTFPHLYQENEEDIHRSGFFSQEPREMYSLERIHVGPDVTVFRGTTQQGDSAIFKYQSNCRQMKRNQQCDAFWESRNYDDFAPTCFIQNDQDPLLSEYVFTKIVAQSFPNQKLCPEVYTLSPPVAIPETLNKKTSTRVISEIGPQACVILYSSIRLIVRNKLDQHSTIAQRACTSFRIANLLFLR
jgi:hypothetical protein